MARKHGSAALLCAALAWGGLVSDAQAQGAPSPDDFQAARAAFEARAASDHGKAAGLNVYPVTPGDHYDKSRLAALQTGALRAFKATADRQTVLQGFAVGAQVAAPPAAVLAALRAGEPVDHDVPGLAALLTAARLGQPDALGYGPLRDRLKFLFEPAGKFGRMCPIAADGAAVRLRWQFQIATSRPRPGGAVPVKQSWLTLRYDPTAQTARITSGSEGC